MRTKVVAVKLDKKEWMAYRTNEKGNIVGYEDYGTTKKMAIKALRNRERWIKERNEKI